jgi:hypothetical protein
MYHANAHKAQAEVSMYRREFQAELMDIPLLKIAHMNLMWNTDKEYMASWYIIKRNFGITTH